MFTFRIAWPTWGACLKCSDCHAPVQMLCINLAVLSTFFASNDENDGKSGKGTDAQAGADPKGLRPQEPPKVRNAQQATADIDGNSHASKWAMQRPRELAAMVQASLQQIHIDTRTYRKYLRSAGTLTQTAPL